MAVEVYSFFAQIPAGTPSTAPVTINLSMPPRTVEAIEIVIPPGPRGQVGFALGQAGVKVIPLGPFPWIVTDDEKIHWPLTDQVNSGAWQFFGYNVGANVHTIILRFLCALVAGASTEPLAPVVGNPALGGVIGGPGILPPPVFPVPPPLPPLPPPPYLPPVGGVPIVPRGPAPPAPSTLPPARVKVPVAPFVPVRPRVPVPIGFGGPPPLPPPPPPLEP